MEVKRRERKSFRTVFLNYGHFHRPILGGGVCKFSAITFSMLYFTSFHHLNKLLDIYSGLPGQPFYITEVPMIAAAVICLVPLFMWWFSNYVKTLQGIVEHFLGESVTCQG